MKGFDLAVRYDERSGYWIAHSKQFGFLTFEETSLTEIFDQLWLNASLIAEEGRFEELGGFDE